MWMQMHSGLTAFAEDASPVRYATALKVMRLSVADVFQIANGQDLTGKLRSTSMPMRSCTWNV
jgi:hypothetical protein